ncbi:unnamed protein product [Lupinus luteus]|uniref:Uncharacterized protein n=1 Tax=Lupinus luteus TaxID=3873 RepID=A0AAV1WRU1_LUPLU
MQITNKDSCLDLRLIMKRKKEIIKKIQGLADNPTEDFLKAVDGITLKDIIHFLKSSFPPLLQWHHIEMKLNSYPTLDCFHAFALQIDNASSMGSTQISWIAGVIAKISNTIDGA